MPNEMTPALKTYEALIRKLKERDVLVAKAVESAHGYRFQNGILYLGYPQHLTNISARILRSVAASRQLLLHFSNFYRIQR